MKKVLTNLFFLIITISSASSDDKNLDLENYCTAVSVFDDTQVCLFNSTMFRVRTSTLEGEKFPAKYMIPFAVGKIENWDKVEYQKTDKDDLITISTDKISIQFKKDGKSWSVWNKADETKIHPSQGVVHGLFKNGYSLFDSASAFNETNINSRYAHNFYNPETKNYTDVYLPEDKIFDQYFIFGPDYPALFNQVNELVGPEPLLPKKSYGFFQTQHLACDGTQAKMMEVAKQLRERGIPTDTLILDFEWGDGCDNGEEIVWGTKTDWAEEYKTPLSPTDMIKQLKDMHYDVMVIRHNAPGFKNRPPQGWTEAVIEEDKWWDAYFERMKEGITGTWQDTRQNDITDSIIWNGTQEYLGDQKRTLFMGARKMMSVNPWDYRFSTVPVNQIIGSRRYPFDWTGDATFSWNELKFQIEAITNSHGSMKAINYISTDSVGATWQIQARWNQFTDFTTISRSHHRKPWNGSFDTKNFENTIKITDRANVTMKEEVEVIEDSDQTAEDSIRIHRKIRYQMLPYIYSHSIENYLTGMPMLRPMILAYPDDYFNNANNWPYQYMFGSEILVAPVYGDFNTMEIYLPKGSDWIDYWNHDVYPGEGVITYDTGDINKLPLFIKAGAIIPNRQDMNWIDTEVKDQITFDIFPAKTSSFDYLEDDNVTLAYQNQMIAKTTLNVSTDDAGTITIDISPISGSFNGMPESRDYGFKINLVYDKPKSIRLNGKMLNDWQYNETTNQVTLKEKIILSSGATFVIEG
ncbi:MAG: DUF5110 domain-containing protein [Kordiimonadaceae bacterium]|jgi:alpha-glucosidase|nr:DUF5110 domain-containing protein [Kordiimonadaceae bacterium]MBT6032885.1 DUF5110 domain-containing protein [Kordiimonadaceae bacterium]